MKREVVEFDSQGERVRGVVYLGNEETLHPIVLLLAGFPPLEEDSWLAHHLASHGINSLSFGYRGTLQSEGNFGVRNVMEDIKAAVDYLHRKDVGHRFKIDTGRFILGGVSFGGGMALAYAARHTGINRIIAIAPDDYGEFAREYRRDTAFASRIDTLFSLFESPNGPIRFSGREALDELLLDPEPFDLRLNAPALADREILLIGGLDDVNVSIEHRIIPIYRALVDAGAESVRFVAYQDDHAFVKSREAMGELMIRWINSSQNT